MTSRYASMSDEDLAACVLQDAVAYDELMRRYEGKLLRYVRRLMQLNVQDAEDLLQETFLKGYTHIGDFDPSLSFSSWIYRIAHNTVRSAYRRFQVRPQVEVTLEDAAVQHLAADVDVAQAADRTLLRSQVRNALAAIPLKYREPLELHYFEGKSVEEISDILQLPRGTVATCMRRGKQRMERFLQQRIPSPDQL